jgi:hypothetical protein
MTCHEDLVMRKFKRKKKQQDKIWRRRESYTGLDEQDRFKRQQ